MEINKRNYKMDFLKFLFTLIVILSHSRAIADEIPEIFDRFHWNAGGHIGVEFFFIVSGYYMTFSYWKKQHEPTLCVEDTAKYIGNKIKRFVQPYLVSFFMLFVVTWTYKTIIAKGIEPTFEIISVGMRKTLYYCIPEILGVYMTGIMDKRYTYNQPTWYISSMILVMIPLYYMLCKNYKFTAKLFAPVVALLLLGWRFNHADTIGYGDWNTFNGFVYTGVIRAFGGICFGIVCYEITAFIKKIQYTTVAKILWTGLEFYGWFAVIRFILASKEKNANSVFILILIMTLLIALSASDITYIGVLFKGRVWRILGSASLYMYLNHYMGRNILHYSFGDNNYWVNLVLLYIIAAVAGFMCHIIGSGLALLSKKLKRLFIQTAG